jgi:serine/threonine-protein kinase HipA
VIAVDQEWRLSPAYDLTPTVAVSVERRDLAMIYGERGRYGNAENLLSQCERFLLTSAPALLWACSTTSVPITIMD